MIDCSAWFNVTGRAFARCRMARPIPCLLLVALVMAAGALSAAPSRAATPAAGAAAITARCRKDLAARLKMPVAGITVLEAQARVWKDASLGMPEPGKAYAQALTPGWRIVLLTRRTRYLYTASARAMRFGGPLDLWDASMLCVRPVTNDPNLNGDLYQCSLIGTNSVRLATGATAIFPQAKGTVLFMRRTSRSGADLLMVRAARGAKEQRLCGAFWVADAALNEAQDTWAAIVHPRLGASWAVTVGRMGQAQPITLPLPDDALPQRIAWSGDSVIVLAKKGNGIGCYETRPLEAAPEWKAGDRFQFPGAHDLMLSKSETLEITQAGTSEKPSVEVARVWFTGDRNIVATLPGLTLRGFDLLGGCAFVWGEKDEKSAAYTVQISTGEVTPGYRGSCSAIRLFQFAPVTRP